MNGATEPIRWKHNPLGAVTVAILLTVPGALVHTDAAFAEGRGFHIGMTVPVEYLDAFFEKIVDNTAPNTRVPEPRRGRVFQDEDSANASVYGIGLRAGYRLPLSERGLYLTGEVDITLHGGTVEGQLEGVGTSSGRNQLGESWPDRWSFGKDRSYGFTAKLGGSPGALRSSEASLYVLAGIRRIDVQFTTRFNGCLDPVPCSSDAGTPDFTSGTDSRDQSFLAWTAGIGLDRVLGEHLVFHAETRYTRYGTERWITPFNDVGVSVPAGVNAAAVSLLVSMAWYF